MIRWRELATVMVLTAALLMAPAAARASDGASMGGRADRVQAAVIYGVTAGALAVGGVVMLGAAVVTFPVLWALQRPFPPSVSIGQPWEHALAMGSLPFVALGSAFLVGAAGFAVVAGAQAAHLM